MFSATPDAAFPCGTSVPGFGLSGPAGELLVQIPVISVSGVVLHALIQRRQTAPVTEGDELPAETEPEKPATPKRRGWWSRG